VQARFVGEIARKGQDHKERRSQERLVATGGLVKDLEIKTDRQTGKSLSSGPSG
jgi:hypothetical protein